MKYLRLSYFDEKKRKTISHSEQNSFGDECFAYSDLLRRSRHSVSGEAPQTARNPTILRCRKGLAEQKLRAAQHAAEFAAWQASGGDFLRSGLAQMKSKVTVLNPQSRSSYH
jgi:hypothetical protein